MDTPHLPDELRSVWAALPTVVTGVRTRDPARAVAAMEAHLTHARTRALGA